MMGFMHKAYHPDDLVVIDALLLPCLIDRFIIITLMLLFLSHIWVLIFGLLVWLPLFVCLVDATESVVYMIGWFLRMMKYQGLLVNRYLNFEGYHCESDCREQKIF